MRTRLWILLLIAVPACRQDMARQPAYRPFRSSALFADGQSMRPAVPGTIARGAPSSSGMRPMAPGDWAQIAGMLGSLSLEPVAAVAVTSDWSLYRDTFPRAITPKIMERGQERFNIYCAVCHDQLGTGKGMVVERGFTAPPSLHTDWSRGFKLRGASLKLKDAPVGYYYEVISHGFGAMPDYAEQIPPDDRWAIAAYIRVLQFSQNATLADVREDQERARLLKIKGGRP
jgi:mono/diheme cytochrome c family protein